MAEFYALIIGYRNIGKHIYATLWVFAILCSIALPSLPIAFAGPADCAKAYGNLSGQKALARSLLGGDGLRSRAIDFYSALKSGIMSQPDERRRAAILAQTVFRNKVNRGLQASERAARTIAARPSLLVTKPVTVPINIFTDYLRGISKEISEHGWWRAFTTQNTDSAKFQLTQSFFDPVATGTIQVANQIRRIFGRDPIPLRARGFISMVASSPWIVYLYGKIDDKFLNDFDKKYGASNTLGARYLSKAFQYGLISNQSWMGNVYNPLTLKNELLLHEQRILAWKRNAVPLPRMQEFRDLGVLANLAEATAFDKIVLDILGDFFATGLDGRPGNEGSLEIYFENQLAGRLAEDSLLKKKDWADIAILKLYLQPTVMWQGETDSQAYYQMLRANEFYHNPANTMQVKKNIRHAYAAFAQEVGASVHPLDLLATASNDSSGQIKVVQEKVQRLEQLSGFATQNIYQVWRSDALDFAKNVPVKSPQGTNTAVTTEVERAQLLFSDQRFRNLANSWREGKVGWHAALMIQKTILNYYNELYSRQQQRPKRNIQMAIRDGESRKITDVPAASPADLCELRGANTGRQNPLFAAANEIASLPLQMQLERCLPKLESPTAEDSLQRSTAILLCSERAVILGSSDRAEEVCRVFFRDLSGLPTDEIKYCLQNISSSALDLTVQRCAFRMAEDIWNIHFAFARTITTEESGSDALNAQLNSELLQTLKQCVEPGSWEDYEKTRGHPVDAICRPAVAK